MNVASVASHSCTVETVLSNTTLSCYAKHAGLKPKPSERYSKEGELFISK